MRTTMPEGFRIKQGVLASSKSSGANGVFIIPINNDKKTRALNVMVSDGFGWDHVSVSLSDFPNLTPSWDDMNYVKELFFEDEETVVQFHPKKSEYVNNHPGVLHLWRSQRYEHALPESILVGFK